MALEPQRTATIIQLAPRFSRLMTGTEVDVRRLLRVVISWDIWAVTVA
jgi:hypothetical protein